MSNVDATDMAGKPGMPTKAAYGEAELRKDLAAAYRLAAHFGWDDLIFTHFSARIPGEEEAFLLNPYGMMFDEITASSLIKVDKHGTRFDGGHYGINPAGFVIHSAIHEARPDAHCVMHLHTNDGVAVACTEQGLLPLNQTAALIHHEVCYHEYEGVATNMDERARLQADLGEKNVMILRNHGTLTVGSSVGAAFNRMYALEWACATQVRTLSMQARVHTMPAEAHEAVNKLANPKMLDMLAQNLLWPALRRKAERLFPDFAS